MKDKRNKDIKLGIFIIMGLVFFIGIVYYIGSQQQLFGRKITVAATFKNVSGLQAGNNVQFSGIKVGTVKSIDIESDSTVKAILLINKDASQFIKKDAIASIVSDGLMGNKIVTISSGSPSEDAIDKGDMLKSKNPVSMDDVISSFKETSDNAKKLTDNLVFISDQIKNSEGLLGKVVTDTTLASKVELMVASLEQSTANAEGITSQIQQAAYKINKGNGIIAKALNDSTWSNQMDNAFDSVSYAGGNLAKASRELDQFMTRLNESKGAIDKLLNDSTVAKNIEETIINVREGTEDLDEVMTTINNSWLLNLFTKKDKNKKGEKQNN